MIRVLQNILAASVYVVTAAAHVSFAAEAGVVDTTSSPRAQIRTVGMNEARWTSGFWADRFELCRTQMVPSMGRLMEGTNYSQFFRNFEITARLATGKAHGASFNDGDFYKFLEGASATLAITNDAALDKRLDEIIAVIARASPRASIMVVELVGATASGPTSRQCGRTSAAAAAEARIEPELPVIATIGISSRWK